jgi:choline kinase
VIDEDPLRDVILEAPDVFGFEDITGLPWIEIDFPEDVVRARTEVLPRLLDLPRAPR